MDIKLKELTEKIYSEGVEKGNAEAKRIVTDAQQKADEIISNAKSAADKIISDAQKSANELKANTNSELKLMGAQIIEALKLEITELLNNKIASESINVAISDDELIKNIVIKLIENWNSSSEIVVSVPEAKQKEMDSFIQSNIRKLLSKKVEIVSINGVKAGFQIGPADNSFKVSFTDKDFENFFKEYIRPRLSKILFN